MRKPVTITEVARALGVSPSTVSRAYNDPGKLKPETVERVRKKAEEVGYAANVHAQALISGRSGAIGLVVPDITNPFFPPIIRAAQRAAEERDLGVFVVDTDDDPEREWSMVQRMLPRVEGFILASSRLEDQRLQLLALRTGVVLINRDVADVSCVLLASGPSVSAAIDEFHARGHRTFVYVGGPEVSWSEQERVAAVRERASALGVEWRLMRAGRGQYDEARQLAGAVTDAGATVAIAFDDVLASGLRDGLLALGILIPEQIALLGCDDALLLQSDPRISTISLPAVEATVEAVRLLCDDAERGQSRRERVVFTGTIQHRSTT